MSTYAGYQRYEVPNLGAVAASTIDKMTERDEKQELLDKQLKQKQEAAAAKALEKQQAKAEKTQENIDKDQQKSISELEKQQADINKGASELKNPGPGAGSFAAAGTQAGDVIKNAANDGLEKAKANPSLIPVIKRNMQDYTVALNRAKTWTDEMAEAAPRIASTDSPYITQTVNENLAGFNPTTTNRTDLVISDDNKLMINVYREGINLGHGKKSFLGVDIPTVNKEWRLTHQIDASSLDGVFNLTKQAKINWEEEENIPLKYGTQEGFAGGVSQKSNKEYQKQRDAFAKKITYGDDNRRKYDAVYRYMTSTGGYEDVIAVDKNASDEDIQAQIKNTGHKKEDVFVMKYDMVNNMIVPVLDEKQQGELEKAIKSHIDGKAEFKHKPKEGDGGEKKAKIDPDIELAFYSKDPVAKAAAVKRIVIRGGVKNNIGSDAVTEGATSNYDFNPNTGKLKLRLTAEKERRGMAGTDLPREIDLNDPANITLVETLLK